MKGKKEVFLAVLTAVLMLSGGGSEVCTVYGAAEENDRPEIQSDQGQEAPIPICGEEEYVFLKRNDGYADIYDCSGQKAGECRPGTEEYLSLFLAEKDEVLVFTDETIINIFSAAELKTLMSVPAEEYVVESYGDVYLVLEKASGRLNLYDNHGELISSMESSSWAGEGMSGCMYRVKDGYLLGVCDYLSDREGMMQGPVWVSMDGKRCKMITNMKLAEDFCSGRVASFGRNLLVFDWDTGKNMIYDLDGNPLLSDIEFWIYPYSDSYWKHNYYAEPEYVIQRSNDMYIYYDTSLNECGIMAASEAGEFSYASGYFTGMSYEELDGQVCTDIALYEGKSWMPAVSMDGEGIMYTGEETVRVPLEEGERLTSMNAAYYMCSFMEDGMYQERLKKRENGAVVKETSLSDTESIMIELGEDCCIIFEEKLQGVEWIPQSQVLDNQGNLCFSSDSQRVYAWKNGLIYLEGEDSRGISDKYGNWIVKA